MTILLDIDSTAGAPDSLLGQENEIIEEQPAVHPPPFIGADLDDTAYDQIAVILQEQQNFYLEFKTF